MGVTHRRQGYGGQAESTERTGNILTTDGHGWTRMGNESGNQEIRKGGGRPRSEVGGPKSGGEKQGTEDRGNSRSHAKAPRREGESLLECGGLTPLWIGCRCARWARWIGRRTAVLTANQTKYLPSRRHGSSPIFNFLYFRRGFIEQQPTTNDQQFPSTINHQPSTGGR